MARRKLTHPEEGQEPPSFEQALEGLESIVDAMEHEPLSLEELVAHYEKGTAYLNHCESILQSARGRIELITLRNQNQIALDAESKKGEDAELAPPPGTREDPDDDDNDDIRLF
jgi:exodeoxyribonuclease VII small subunit